MNNGHTGWLAPSGEFIECDTQEHMRIAKKLAIKLNIDDDDCNADNVLVAHGWIRISFMAFFEHGYVFRGIYHSSDSQKTFLRKYFDEQKEWIASSGFDDLYFMGVIDGDELKEAKGGEVEWLT